MVCDPRRVDRGATVSKMLLQYFNESSATVKISIVTPRFAYSGVPLAQVRFAQAFARRGHEVDLLIGYVQPEIGVPNLPGLNLKILGLKRVKDMLLPLYRHFRSSKPEVIFSAEDHLNFMVLLAATLAGSKAKISGSSRVTPFDTYSNQIFSKRWFLKHLMKAMMWRSDALTCVSKDMVDQYRQIFPSCRHVCVYNIVKTDDAPLRMQETVDHPWFVNKEAPVVVAAGTLAYWKGFDVLIRAFHLVTQKRNARLVLLGDGPLRSELEDLVQTLGLGGRVQFLGFQDNPLKFFHRSDVFALSSHVEGLPNVLVEAMMCGCTVVSTDCPTGPREVLQDERFGYLVPTNNPPALAEGILAALDNRIHPSLLAEAIVPFEEERVIRRHLEILGIA